MSRLVSANFSRVIRNKFFLICLVIVCGFSAFVAIRYMQNNPWCREQISHATKRECFKYAPVVTAMVALFLNLFLGEEYGSRTIRNKVTAGYSKGKIYGANWLVCAVIGGGIYLLAFLITALPIAPWTGLLKENGNIVAEFLKAAFIDLCAILAVVSIVVCVTMLVKNRVVSLVIVVVGVVFLWLATIILYDEIREPKTIVVIDGKEIQIENPDYESGTKRMVCQALMDIQPFGQMGLVLVNRATGAREILLPLYSCLIMVIFGVSGAYLFSKKDLE